MYHSFRLFLEHVPASLQYLYLILLHARYARLHGLHALLQHRFVAIECVRVRARHRKHRRAAACVRAAHVAYQVAHVLVAVVRGLLLRGLLLRSFPQRDRNLRQVHHHQRDGARREEHAVRAHVLGLPRKDLQLLRVDLALDALAGGEHVHEAGLAGLALAHHRQLHAVARLRALVQRAHVPQHGRIALAHHLARGRDQVAVVAEPQLLQVGQGADGRGDARQATAPQRELTQGGLAGRAQEGVDERRHVRVAQLRVAVEPQLLQVGQGADGRGDARQATVGEAEPLDGAMGGEGVDERRRALVAQRGVAAHAERLEAR
eukprot:scaffold2044_cov202-Prasinococcus_capsulatus_cf.AAC.8